MKTLKHIVIIGATSGIAVQCARIWAEKGPVRLTLVGRDLQRLKRIGDDILVRSPDSDVGFVEANFLDPESIEATVNGITEKAKADIVLIAHGTLPEQRDCQNELTQCREALEINGVSPVLCAEAFAMHMEKINHGTIVLLGSVAGDRGRKSNYVYGAGKGMVTRYAQGLQHRFAGTGVKVVLIKPGPTDTPMTAHLKNNGVKLAPVKFVAERIVKAVVKGRSVVYVPGKWRFIMCVIRHLPESIFNRLDI